MTQCGISKIVSDYQTNKKLVSQNTQDVNKKNERICEKSNYN